MEDNKHFSFFDDEEFKQQEVEEINKQDLIKQSLNNEKYTSKVDTPIYNIKLERKPAISELFDNTKTNELEREIENSSLDKMEKNFLLCAAKRHTVFNYAKIAEYYAFATPEMKDLMEKSALVIIDYNKAIEYGFVKLQNFISKSADELKKKRDEERAKKKGNVSNKEETENNEK